MSMKNGQLREITKSTVWVTVFIHLLLCVFGQLVAPQDVQLTSENFRYIVTWKPGVGTSPDTRYTVEISNLNNAQGKFTPVKRCTNITAHSCDLSRRFKSFSNLYWAQVKSVTNQSESSWVESKELLPIRDTIVGPPIVMVESNLQIIEVTLDMPLTPHKEEDSHKLKTLRDIDPYLIYIILFVDENGKAYTNRKVKPDKSGKGYYRFENLKSNFTYCVVARFESLHNYHMKDSRKICKTTSTQNTDILWIAPLVAGAGFIVVLIITGIGIWMMKEFTYLHLVQSDLPKSLIQQCRVCNIG
ncbi:interferon lambda receptor 1-like isoform X2 [Amblyraja radiata]|uniref:interferon lambda receptor 1-like isoform X2 n=1 Tax=Amblyraja radiata TaxID=386614 RepID=UPI001403659A|nr:interferon lambda receptor 1-like isoform X2 [Amblyraja radiata]